MAGTCHDSRGYHGILRLPSHETWKPAETLKIVPFSYSVCFCMSLDFSIFTLWNKWDADACRRTGEKALLEELEKHRQGKAALICRLSSPEQSLYWLRKKSSDGWARRVFRLIPTSCFCSQRRICPPWKYPGWRRKSARVKKKSPEL